MKAWVDQKVTINGFASTSILKSASYSTKPVKVVILAPERKSGAGYIQDISYSAAHLGKTEAGYTLSREHEVLLQKGSKFTILEAQRFKDKTIIVAKWGEEDV